MLSIPEIARGVVLTVACGSADLAEIANFLGITPSVDTEAIQVREMADLLCHVLHLLDFMLLLPCKMPRCLVQHNCKYKLRCMVCHLSSVHNGRCCRVEVAMRSVWNCSILLST